MATRRRIKQSLLTKAILQAAEQGSLSISEAHWKIFTEMRTQQDTLFNKMDEINARLTSTTKEIRQLLIEKGAIGAIKKTTRVPKGKPRLGKG